MNEYLPHHYHNKPLNIKKHTPIYIPAPLRYNKQPISEQYQVKLKPKYKNSKLDRVGE